VDGNEWEELRLFHGTAALDHLFHEGVGQDAEFGLASEATLLSVLLHTPEVFRVLHEGLARHFADDRLVRARFEKHSILKIGEPYLEV